MVRSKIIVLFLFALALFACNNPQTSQTNNNNSGNSNAAKDPSRRTKIGFAMATVKEERWQRDRVAFEEACKRLNVDCVITVADNDASRQANDVDNLLTQGIDVLVSVFGPGN